MKIKVFVGNQILASGVEKLIVENLLDAVFSDAFRDAGSGPVVCLCQYSLSFIR